MAKRRTVEGTDSYDRILDAAEALFAERGYDRTPIKEIARRSGLNSALIYYYFGRKQGLYTFVLRRVLSGVTYRMRSALDMTAKTPADAVRQFVRVQSELLADNPRIPRLVLRELAEHQSGFIAPLLREFAVGVFDRLCELIRKGQRSGAFDPALDPKFTAISIVSQVFYIHLAQPSVAVVLDHGDRKIPREALLAFADHAAEFAVAALRPPREKR